MTIKRKYSRKRRYHSRKRRYHSRKKSYKRSNSRKRRRKSKRTNRRRTNRRRSYRRRMKGGSRDTAPLINAKVISDFRANTSRKVAEKAAEELKQNAKKEIAFQKEKDANSPLGQMLIKKEKDEKDYHPEDITKKHQEDMKNEVLMTSEKPQTKKRKFVVLKDIFSSYPTSLQSVRDEQEKWKVAIDLVLALHHAASYRERFRVTHRVRSDESYDHFGTGKTDIETLLHAIQSVSTKKGELSTQIHPQALIHLFKELLEQLKFELQFRSTQHRQPQIEQLIGIDMIYLQNFRYILEWFGEKLLACMIHLSLTINSAHNHTLNVDFVEKQLLHGIDRLIAIPVALSVGVVAPVKVEKKVAKVLDSISDKLIQGKLDRHLLHFITIIEQLYQNLIHSFESSPLFNKQIAMQQQLSMKKYGSKSKPMRHLSTQAVMTGVN